MSADVTLAKSNLLEQLEALGSPQVTHVHRPKGKMCYSDPDWSCSVFEKLDPRAHAEKTNESKKTFMTCIIHPPR